MHANGHGGDWLLVLACDMPYATGEAFDDLLRAAEGAGADAAMFGDAQGLEPFYAVYHARLLPIVRRALDDGRRRMVGFHDDVHVVTLPPPREGTEPLCNVNTPGELERCGTAQEGWR